MWLTYTHMIHRWFPLFSHDSCTEAKVETCYIHRAGISLYLLWSEPRFVWGFYLASFHVHCYSPEMSNMVFASVHAFRQTKIGAVLYPDSVLSTCWGWDMNPLAVHGWIMFDTEYSSIPFKIGTSEIKKLKPTNFAKMPTEPSRILAKSKMKNPIPADFGLMRLLAQVFSLDLENILCAKPHYSTKDMCAKHLQPS